MADNRPPLGGFPAPGADLNTILHRELEPACRPLIGAYSLTLDNIIQFSMAASLKRLADAAELRNGHPGPAIGA